MKDKINQLKETLIIEAASRYFTTFGYSGTQIDKLAKELGIGVGTIYSMFESKEGLFISWIFSVIERAYQELRLEFEKQNNPFIQCKIFVDFKLNHYEKNKPVFRDYMQNNQLFLKNTSRRKENPIKKVYNMLAESIERLVAENKYGQANLPTNDYYLFAYLLDSVVNSYIERFAEDCENVNLATKTDEIMKIFLNCIGARELVNEM